jgi:Leucine-rich repeat (LRR) protein
MVPSQRTQIPESFGGLESLEKLHLNHNKLSGEIPASLARASKLHQLELQNNELSGPLPPEIGGLKELVQLDLNDNELEGEVPSSYGDLTDLHRLDLHNNLLTGPIPEHLFDSQMSQLALVDLSSNRFSGHIPLGLCRMVHLASLNLAGNDEIIGEVPHCALEHGIHASDESRARCQEQLRPFCKTLKGRNEL